MASSLTLPSRLHYAFAYAGTKNTIPDGAASPLASFNQGFPPPTFTPIASGGVPPAGADFNGIFYQLSNVLLWLNAGGRFPFDAAIASAQGGYPLGVVIKMNDGYSYVVNTVDGNTNDPNTTFTGWAPFGGYLAGAGNYGQDTGAVNAYACTMVPPISTNRNGLKATFKVTNTNTGASTLNVGGGAVGLVRIDGSAVQAGDVAAGSILTATFDSVSNKFVLDAPSPSLYSVNNNTTATGVFNAAHPAGSTTMDGLALLITPRSSGKVMVQISGSMTPAGATANSIQLRYGTGAAPANGAAFTGTIVTQGVCAITGLVTITGVITGLAIGTQYWVDVAIAPSGGTEQYAGVSALVMEV